MMLTFTFICVAFRLLGKEVFMPFSEGEVLQDIIPTSKSVKKIVLLRISLGVTK